MFRFVVQHLRWLARIPGLPQLFDALLLSWTAIAHRPRLAVMEALEARVLALPGVSPQVHRFGGTGFRLAGPELGHLHGNGLLDVFVGKCARAALVATGRAEPHHIFPQSGWVSFWLLPRTHSSCWNRAPPRQRTRGASAVVFTPATRRRRPADCACP